MKYQQLTRLFVQGSLENQTYALSNLTDIHYLTKVMRKKVNDHVLVFNEEFGEYLAKIIELANKKIIFSLEEQTRKTERQLKLNLIFAPIKHPRINFLLEKATELGVNELIPVVTKHTIIDKINYDKWSIYTKEAAEQCCRLSLPKISPIQKFDDFIETWSKNREILFCNEREESLHISTYLKTKASLGEVNIMIGPEGGFSAQEIEMLKSKKFTTSIHLGERILRAETAALAALSIGGMFLL